MKRTAVKFVSALGLVLALAGAAMASEPRVLRSDNVYAKGTAECPIAVVAGNGDLIVTFANHGDVMPGCEAPFIRSSDGGKTWSDVYLKFSPDDPKEHGVAVFGLLRRKDDAILAMRIEIQCPGGQVGAHRTAKLEILLSKDNGTSFETISKLNFPEGKMAAPYGPMVQLADDSIIMPGFIEQVGNGYWRTTDGGKTWSDFRTVWKDPPEGVRQNLWFNETAYEVLKDGSIIALARNDVNDLLYAIESKDHGKTWSEPCATNIVGGSPALLRMADGSVILAHRDAGRPGLTISRSTDGGKTWHYLYALPVAEGIPDLPNPRWSRPAVDLAWQPGEAHVGYPALVTLADGNIYAVWHVHNRNSPPAAPGRDTYGLAGNLLSNSTEAVACNGGEIFPVSQTGAILRAQVISGPGATASLVNIPGKLRITPQRVENRTNADAEVHANEDDIFYILDGKATFHLGGTLHDTWEYSPGNQAGHEQRGATETVVGPGDLVFVPRGTVHRLSCPDGFVEMLMIKRAEK